MATISSSGAQAPSITSLPVICGVYCITHIETGRRYVGQSIDCVRRMLEHARYNEYPIGHAIRLYGRDAFRFEILSVVPRDRLLACEAGWISLLETAHPNGFNVTDRAPRKAPSVNKAKRNAAQKRAEQQARFDRTRGIFA